MKNVKWIFLPTDIARLSYVKDTACVANLWHRKWAANSGLASKEGQAARAWNKTPLYYPMGHASQASSILQICHQLKSSLLMSSERPWERNFLHHKWHETTKATNWHGAESTTETKPLCISKLLYTFSVHEVPPPQFHEYSLKYFGRFPDAVFSRYLKLFQKQKTQSFFKTSTLWYSIYFRMDKSY